MRNELALNLVYRLIQTLFTSLNKQPRGLTETCMLNHDLFLSLAFLDGHSAGDAVLRPLPRHSGGLL